ncbi:dephospho-CoA kinase [Candidatus Purcelliella pentastirinorum]|uniref:dephospho-CoA kinase n=1 Tax=Candidatus Purcelliella pentastirinorum TaxID=472834 RepID=UPI002368C481|nr:dephospho-CoA kinase [Candidatus Purcelliella pentastirinorum]WDI79039.1 dephospho-CoA kinase [Candidatus Purcelliella pentastirinorum]
MNYTSLIKYKYKKNTNRILVINVSKNTQIKKTMLRDNYNYYQTKNIISTQDKNNKHLNLADDIIKNEKSIDN